MLKLLDKNIYNRKLKEDEMLQMGFDKKNGVERIFVENEDIYFERKTKKFYKTGTLFLDYLSDEISELYNEFINDICNKKNIQDLKDKYISSYTFYFKYFFNMYKEDIEIIKLLEEEKLKDLNNRVIEGLKKIEIEKAEAGDIVAVAGLSDISVGETLCNSDELLPLPILHIDEPTLQMTIGTNSSPFCGNDGKILTARKIEERLMKETQRDVSLKVAPNDTESWIVSGRGELHLGILIENMRREGFELEVSKPRVIIKEENGKKLEPYEELQIECPEESVGNVIEQLGHRGASMESMNNINGQVRLIYTIPSRGLIGFTTNFLTITKGYGIINHTFKEYKEITNVDVGERSLGVLVSIDTGKATAYSLGGLEDRGIMFIEPGTDVYEGMIVGEHSRENDLAVNVTKGKNLTNIRAAGSDHTVVLKRPRPISLEYALDYINSDELVEVTPNFIRLRKRILNTTERKKFDSRN